MTPQQLKNSILQLAIQGKLVEQRPEEGTAKELLQEISAEKRRLIREGKIKKAKPLPEISEDEIPFEVPESWEWVRLGDIVCKEIKRGKSPVYATTSNIMVFAQKCNTKTGKIDLQIAKFLDETTISKYPESEFLKYQDIIVNSTGIGTMGRIGMFLRADNPKNMLIVPDSHVTLVRAMEIVSTRYIFYLMKANQSYFESMGEGSTKQKELKPATIANFLVPLPPLAEQHRIVSKIEELLPYIDQYDKAYTKLNEWNEKFPEAIKKSILQCAMEGKLVEQRPEEGTAEELLREIRAEKERLVKEGKIKKTKPLPEISEDEIPFEVPESWEWVRLGDIVYNQGQEKPSEPFAYIDIGSIDNTKQCLSEKENIILPENAPSRARKKVKKGDIIYATVRPYLHNMCIIDREFSREPIASTGFAVMTTHVGVNNRYLFFYLLAPTFDAYVNSNENSKGVAYPAINDKALYSAIIPLPPLAEQKRIVTRIEELLSHCNAL